MIMMGDPRHIANTSFDVGTATMDGLFPRPANQSCDSFASIIQSYCDEGDPFCAGGNDTLVHLGYTKKYNDAALNFTNAKIKAMATTSNGEVGNNASGDSSAASRLGGASGACVVAVGLATVFALL